MRINLNTPGANEVSTDRTSIATTSTSSSSHRTNGDQFTGDTVNVTSLTAQTLQMPAVRQEKVDALRAQIASGKYDIDPRGTAEAMLNQ